MRTALYVRTSEAYQQTLPDQLRDCRAVAARDGARIVAELSDQESGLSETRDGYRALLELARGGAIDRVIVWKLDRFGRSQVENTARLQELLRLGVGIVSCMEGPIDEFLGGLLSVFAQRESRNISDRVLLKMRALAAEGRNLTTPAFGYRAIPGKPGYLEEVPHEAALLRQLYARWITEDSSYQELADWLNSQRHPETGAPVRLHRGGVFTARWVRVALSSPRYIGRPVWGKRRTGNLDARTRRPPSQHVQPPAAPSEGGVPALVDEDTWQRAQERIRQRAYRHAAARATSDRRADRYLLTGLLYCGACRDADRRGTRMTTERHGYRPQDSSRERLPLYRCPRHMTGHPRCPMRKRSARAVDHAVRHQLAGLVVPADLIPRLEAAEKARAQRAPATVQLAAQRAALGRLTEQRIQLGLDKLAGVFSAEEYKALAARLTTQIDAGAARIAALERQHTASALTSVVHGHLPALTALQGILRDGTIAEQRAVLSALTDGVVLRASHPAVQIEILWQPWVLLLAEEGILTLPAACPAPLLSTVDAGRLLGISRKRLAQLIRQGRIPATRAGERWLLDPAVVAALPPRTPGRPRTHVRKSGDVAG